MEMNKRINTVLNEKESIRLMEALNDKTTEYAKKSSDAMYYNNDVDKYKEIGKTMMSYVDLAHKLGFSDEELEKHINKK